MINLLPRENKVFVKAEYLKRLFVLTVVFFVSATIVSTVFIVMFFLLFADYRKDLSRQLNLSLKQTNASEVAGAVSDINKLNSRISILKNRENKTELNSIIEKIVSIKAKGVKLNSLNYETSQTADGKNKIFLAGEAIERQNLLDFTNSLKKEFGSEKVVSPVSNLLNKKNADFYLTILNVNQHEKQ